MNQDFKLSQLSVTINNTASTVNAESKRNFGRLWEAYIKISDLLWALIKQGTKNPEIVPESASKRISITANLLQSSTIVERLISGGFYWASSAMLRQHMEALARIVEIRSGNSGTEKRTPNVRVLPFRLKQNYGRLSELCHVAGGELLRDFALTSEGEEYASALPVYNDEWSRNLFSVHISHMMVLSIEIYLLHKELYPDIEILEIEDSVLAIIQILTDEGFWKKE